MNTDYFAKRVQERVQQEESKQTLSETWGPIMYPLGVFGAGFTGIIGGLFDFSVLYGITYAITAKHALSIIISALLAVGIQVGFGKSAFQLMRSLYNGDHHKQEYRYTLATASLVLLFMFSFTLFLSFKTEYIVGTLATNTMELELTDEAQITAAYDAKERELRAAKATELADARARVQSLYGDKTRSGEVRWNAHKSVSEIEQKQIPQIQKSYEGAIAAVQEERREALNLARGQNQATTSKFSDVVSMGATTTKFWNVAINILRLIMIFGWSVFLADAGREGKGKRSNAPSTLATAFSQAPRPAMVTAEYKPPMSGPLGGLPTASAGEGAAIDSPPLGKSHSANPAIAEQVVVKPFHNNRVVDLEVPRMVQWNVAEDDEAATTTPATATKKSVGKTAANATATRGNSNNSNDDNIIVYVNKKGVRKEYLPSDITKQLPTLAARIKAAEKKRTAARAAGDLKALASAEAVIENNTKALERFRALLEKHGA